jgi:hypothetical protein
MEAVMKYVSVLTPPALVCAAFLVAVVAFLRHEMGRGRRAAKDDQPAEIPDADAIAPRDAQTGTGPGSRSERPDDD